MERDGKMRILVDINILFSALVFPRSKLARALLYIADNHEVVLYDRNIAGYSWTESAKVSPGC